MKKVTLIFIVLATLFAMPSLSYAQTPNYTVNLPVSNVFEYAQSSNGSVVLEWKLPRYIGDAYEGQTAKEMLLWSIQDYSNIMLKSFQVSYGDDDYLYGYARLIFGANYPFTVTITGLCSFSTPNAPSTRVFNYFPY